jgi:hypothetical protein
MRISGLSGKKERPIYRRKGERETRASKYVHTVTANFLPRGRTIKSGDAVVESYGSKKSALDF